MNKLRYFILLTVAMLGCNNTDLQFDATGNFEADETIVSAEANGKLLQLTIEEGQEVKAGQQVGLIDTVQLHLRKKQLEYTVSAALSKKPDMAKQLSSIQEKIDFTKREKTRFENLLKDDAATQKQVDDLSAQLEIYQREYNALQSSLQISTTSINKEVLPIQAQIDQLDDQLQRSKITAPKNGIVLAKYAEAGEVAMNGKALFKMADVSVINLRAYISGTQLPSLIIGQEVRVMVDANAKEYNEFKGKVIWISDKAEFTPKTIQTKEERANLVYAIKIAVPNDGTLKIGMYGEVLFQ